MSFVISTHGQFRPYFDAKTAGVSSRSMRVRSSNELDAIGDETFLEVLGADQAASKKQNFAANQYQKSAKTFREKKKCHYARDVMSKDLKILSPDKNVADGLNMLHREKIRHLLIFEDNTFKGMVSNRDLLGNSPNASLNDVMTKDVLMARDNARLAEIAMFMVNEKIGALPILDHQDLIVGIVTETDLLRYIFTEMDFETWA